MTTPAPSQSPPVELKVDDVHIAEARRRLVVQLLELERSRNEYVVDSKASLALEEGGRL